jgi:hypothetical protein
MAVLPSADSATEVPCPAAEDMMAMLDLIDDGGEAAVPPTALHAPSA